MGGKFIVKAGQHIFDVGENVSVKLPSLPLIPNQLYSAAFTFSDDAKQPMANYNYILVSETGEVVEGVTDELGKTQPIQSDDRAKVDTYIADAPNTEEQSAEMPLLELSYEELFGTDDPDDELDDIDKDF